MKKQLLGLTCLTLGLTGCGNNSLSSATSEPQTTVITMVETPSATVATTSAPRQEQTTTSSPETNQVTQQAAQQESVETRSSAPQPTETPVQAIQLPTEANTPLQNFAGRTLKGNDIYFVIFPEADQQSIKAVAHADGFSGSWGSICSNMATHEQLRETAIETYPSSGSMTLWYSYDYAFYFSEKTNETAAATKAKILEVANQYAEGYASCKPFYTTSASASSTNYTSAAVGQFENDLPTSNKVPINKL